MRSENQRCGWHWEGLASRCYLEAGNDGRHQLSKHWWSDDDEVTRWTMVFPARPRLVRIDRPFDCRHDRERSRTQLPFQIFQAGLTDAVAVSANAPDNTVGYSLTLTILERFAPKLSAQRTQENQTMSELKLCKIVAKVTDLVLRKIRP